MLVAKRRITSRFGEPTRAPARAQVIEAPKCHLPQWKTVLELQKEGVLTDAHCGQRHGHAAGRCLREAG